MENREFNVNGKRYAIVESGNELMKWQAVVFDTSCNAWVKTCYFGRTQSDIKEVVKDGNRLINMIEC